MLKAHGMKKKKSFFGSILTVFKKVKNFENYEESPKSEIHLEN